ncbi:MAG: HEAT repeat domain-containing protein, partial [Actinomycetia bacterium]|nr:HEAT repeat domain-containing protein [Actinomycetes bacterium]
MTSPHSGSLHNSRGCPRYQTRRAQRIAHILSDDPHLAPTATRQLTEFVITSSHRIPSLTAAETFTTLVATHPALELDDPLAIEALVDLAANHPDWSARRDATRLLANIARTNPTAQQACTDQLVNSDPDVQLHAWLAPTTPPDTPAPKTFTAQHVEISGKDQPSKIRALVDLMATTTNDSIRSRAAQVLVSVDSTM